MYPHIKDEALRKSALTLDKMMDNCELGMSDIYIVLQALNTAYGENKQLREENAELIKMHNDFCDKLEEKFDLIEEGLDDIESMQKFILKHPIKE